MLRYFTSFIFIGLSIAIFVIFTGALYKNIQTLKAEQATYDEALTNSKALENERDKLTAKYSTIDTENLNRIKRLLPDSVDNIRLILEIEKIAAPYGMALKDVQYNVAPVEKDSKSAPGTSIVNNASMKDSSANKNYGSWDLGFSVTSTYSNFIHFLKDLESNLRLVDVSSIQFSATSVGVGGSSSVSEVYRYSFNIKTYWLKN